MMNAELSTPSPPPLPHGNASTEPRGAPCAGLFGWRKDNAVAPKAAADPKRPGGYYPAG